MTPEERESVLLAATPRPWERDGMWIREEGDAAGIRSIAQTTTEAAVSGSQISANAELIVRAVNEYEAHLDGEELLRGVLDYFRLYDLERTDGRTSPVIPKIEDVLARLDAARTA